jgi:hypothetical protein
MCLIAHRDNIGANIPNEIINYNRSANPDGFGIAWRDAEVGLTYEKFGPEDFEAFRSLLKDVDQSPVEYVAHWRKATHGPICADMSHPFSYMDRDDKQVLAFHNGIIQIPTDKSESDTAAFVRRILVQLEHRWWRNEGIMTLVEDYVGWSRLLFMTQKETVYVNPQHWVRENGINYSTTPIYRPIVKPAKASTWKRVSPDVLKPQSMWTHGGHPISPVSQVDSTDDDDKFGSAICNECKTEGEYYVIEGRVYIDIDHIIDEEDY